MHPIHDVDSPLLLAIALSSKRRAAELVEIIAAFDLLQGSLPAGAKLAESMRRLSASGLIGEAGGRYTLTPDAQAMVAGLPKKAATEERLSGIKDELSRYAPKAGSPAIVITDAEIAAAVLAHRTALADGQRALMVPKPRPPEDNGRGPGFRKRKPMPARRRKA